MHYPNLNIATYLFDFYFCELACPACRFCTGIPCVTHKLLDHDPVAVFPLSLLCFFFGKAVVPGVHVWALIGLMRGRKKKQAPSVTDVAISHLFVVKVSQESQVLVS